MVGTVSERPEWFKGVGAVSSPRVIVVEDDDDLRQLFQVYLECFGARVEAVSNGSAGFRAAVARPPDLIITDLRMPDIDGLTLIRMLRRAPQLEGLSILCVTAQSDVEIRLEALGLGVDGYLRKPLVLEEMLLVVRNLLWRRLQQRKNPTRAAASRIEHLAGDVQHVSLSSLLVLLEMERGSGLLTLSAPGASARGRIFVNKGRIVQAFVDGGPKRTGADAIYELLRWSRGNFRFKVCEVRMEDNVQASTTALLMEAARRVDEEGRPADAVA